MFDGNAACNLYDEDFDGIPSKSRKRKFKERTMSNRKHNKKGKGICMTTDSNVVEVGLFTNSEYELESNNTASSEQEQVEVPMMSIETAVKEIAKNEQRSSDTSPDEVSCMLDTSDSDHASAVEEITDVEDFTTVEDNVAEKNNATEEDDEDDMAAIPPKRERIWQQQQPTEEETGWGVLAGVGIGLAIIGCIAGVAFKFVSSDK